MEDSEKGRGEVCGFKAFCSGKCGLFFLFVPRGFNTPPFRAAKKVLNLRVQYLGRTTTPPFRAGLLILCHNNINLFPVVISINRC